MNVLFGESLAVSPRWEFSHLPSSLLVQLLCARSGGQGGVGAPGWLACNYQTTQPLVFRDLSEFHPNLSFIFSPPCIFTLHVSKYPCTKNQSVTGRWITRI